MKLQQMIHRTGLCAVLATGPSLAWAAEGSAGGLGDNLPILGLAAALLIFAFTRKAEKSTPVAPPAPEPVEAPAAEAPAVAEATVEASEAATEEAASEPAAAESEQASTESAG